MLASLADLSALGAIPVDCSAEGTQGQRALRLLNMASGLVCAYLGVEEADLDLTGSQRTGLSAVVAEVAASRLNVTAAPSSDPYAYQGSPAALMLTAWHKRSIDGLNIVGRPGSNSFSMLTPRDIDSSYLGDAWASSVFVVNGPDAVDPFLVP